MLESQRNEYVAGLVEIGNRADAVLHERNAAYSEEIQRLKHQAEAYVGSQNEDIARLRHELASVNAEMNSSGAWRNQLVEHEKEAARKNQVLRSELVMSKANSQHPEAEISLMQNTLKDRLAIFNSEIASLQSTIQNQKDLQVQRSGFTEEEIRSYLTAYLIRKISAYQDEFRQESMTLQSMMRSESDVAKLYKSRYEDITQVTMGSDSNTENIMKALKDRLDHEVDLTDHYRSKRDEADQKRVELEAKLRVEESEAKNNEKPLEDAEHRRDETDKNWPEARPELRERDRKVAFLESETHRLRDDRNERKAHSQQLYEELWENEECQNQEEANGERPLSQEKVNPAIPNPLFREGKSRRQSLFFFAKVS